MDVIKYRQIILGGRTHSTPILISKNSTVGEWYLSYMRSIGYFHQNDDQLCIGWLVRGRVLPVFQSTRHRNWLQSIQINLALVIRQRHRRHRRTAFWTLMGQRQLTSDVVREILQWC
jgi:hypothetical protein